MKKKETINGEDIESVASAEFIPWEKLQGTTLLVTGATGLIGTSFIKAIDYVNTVKKLNIKVLALVRNEAKAAERFAEIISHGMIRFVAGSVEQLPVIEDTVDYIIHAASQTASKEFVQHAVETIETSVLGTFNLLKLAKVKHCRGFIYLSSMEVYGYPEKGHKVRENENCLMAPLDIRNSYPIGKVMSEAMCCAYAKEYNVPAMICRLTQTFGPGVHYNDNRIFAYFGRCVKEKNNIVLKTKGETERCYLYTADAVTAILTVMLKGEPGQAYNVADENTYCSIAEMAERVASDNGIQVEYDIQDAAANGYLQTLYMYLDTSKLQELGWKPQGYSIVEMYRRMFAGMEI